ncbi:MAG: hypothetical protein GX975_01680, partial [Clostridiales bacterium]|nr:hypothetical protein [Clostridiales bacterium]
MDKKKGFKIVLYIISFFLLVILIKNLDLVLVSEAIKKVPARLLLCCLGMQLVTEMLLSYQWHRIARTLKLPGTYASHLWANSVESFFDAITPGAKIGGELMRVIFFKEELGYSNIEA